MQRRRSVPHTFEEILQPRKPGWKPGLPGSNLVRKGTGCSGSSGKLETASHINQWLSSPGLQPPEPA
jgi:hypothetical protein